MTATATTVEVEVAKAQAGGGDDAKVERTGANFLPRITDVPHGEAFAKLAGIYVGFAAAIRVFVKDYGDSMFALNGLSSHLNYRVGQEITKDAEVMLQRLGEMAEAYVREVDGLAILG